MAARSCRKILLAGDALDQAVDQNWDLSVLSLTAYPQVLVMMNDKFTGRSAWRRVPRQPAAGHGHRQTLRGMAQAVGNLQSTLQQTVMNQKAS
jgi:hypothetical protein